MRDYKSSLLILLSVLLLISAGLLFTALYHFYYKTPYQVPVVKEIQKLTTVPFDGTHDSLLKIYNASINDLDRGFDSIWHNTDSLKTNLDIRLIEYYQLQNEIKRILSDKSKGADIKMAGQKIIELQEIITSLRNTNLNVVRENQKLNALLNQLTDNEKIVKQNSTVDVIESSVPVKKIIGNDVFTLSDLRFTAIQINDNREQETNKTDQTEKLTASFKVSNKNIQNNNAEIMVVVLQPNGKVFQNSPWDTGTFETTEGKKIYTARLRFEYNSGESKQLMFSLTADQFQQGTYTLNIYQNGKLIGKMVKTLS